MENNNGAQTVLDIIHMGVLAGVWFERWRCSPCWRVVQRHLPQLARDGLLHPELHQCTTAGTAY